MLLAFFKVLDFLGIRDPRVSTVTAPSTPSTEEGDLSEVAWRYFILGYWTATSVVDTAAWELYCFDCTGGNKPPEAPVLMWPEHANPWLRRAAAKSIEGGQTPPSFAEISKVVAPPEVKGFSLR